MCGIAGVIHRDRSHAVDQSVVRTMMTLLSHRGPDGEGLWGEGPVALGHKRLSIIDLEAGH